MDNNAMFVQIHFQFKLTELVIVQRINIIQQPTIAVSMFILCQDRRTMGKIYLLRVLIIALHVTSQQLKFVIHANQRLTKQVLDLANVKKI
jgi:hypothetical protein